MVRAPDVAGPEPHSRLRGEPDHAPACRVKAADAARSDATATSVAHGPNGRWNVRAWAGEHPGGAILTETPTDETPTDEAPTDGPCPLSSDDRCYRPDARSAWTNRATNATTNRAMNATTSRATNATTSRGSQRGSRRTGLGYRGNHLHQRRLLAPGSRRTTAPPLRAPANDGAFEAELDSGSCLISWSRWHPCAATCGPRLPAHGLCNLCSSPPPAAVARPRGVFVPPLARNVPEK